MVALAAVLKALTQAVKRDLATLRSIGLNNFFFFGVLLVYSSLAGGRRPLAAIPFLVLIGLVMLLPMSSDPLGKIPASRFSLWPLTGRQRLLLRIASLGLNPVFWLALPLLALLVREPVSAFLLLATIAGSQCISSVSARSLRLSPRMNPLLYLPSLPGRFGGMVRHNLRQIVSVLDFYVALVLSVGASAYRWLSPQPEPRAFLALSMVVALSLSTYTQCFFGLDSGGFSRYRLMPLRGWQILLTKDTAYFLVLLVLVLPIGPGPGLTFGLVSVVLGRYPALAVRTRQYRWRFTSGDGRFGISQMIAGAALGVAEYEFGAWVLAAVVCVYVAALYIAGRYWDEAI
ncbi:MAG TPA: hypothetical protein VKZ53_05935 [Candidatus Angelobacter sp.]|nr:hypothetical protein [Candidatus Angelobacter sp.]